MLLTPTEMERLTIFMAAELARKRRAKGLALNHPEAVALIVDEILEGAREGRGVADLISWGSTILSTDDVMPGVAALMPIIQVEGLFPDGSKLVTVHDPIRPGSKSIAEGGVVPGEIITGGDEDVEINAGRPRVTLTAVNTGDRPIQVGSHYHFFETNKALHFDRARSFGMHLDIREPLRRGESGAWVNDDHIKTKLLRHRHQSLADVNRANGNDTDNGSLDGEKQLTFRRLHHTTFAHAEGIRQHGSQRIGRNLGL